MRPRTGQVSRMNRKFLITLAIACIIVAAAPSFAEAPSAAFIVTPH
jgi:hypothetical protein